MNQSESCCRSPAPPPVGVEDADRRGSTRRGKGWRIGLGLAQWGVPALILVLMPKCPACLAAYLAIGTGISLSTSDAATVQSALIVLCASILTLLAIRTVLAASRP